MTATWNTLIFNQGGRKKNPNTTICPATTKPQLLTKSGYAVKNKHSKVISQMLCTKQLQVNNQNLDKLKQEKKKSCRIAMQDLECSLNLSTSPHQIPHGPHWWAAQAVMQRNPTQRRINNTTMEKVPSLLWIGGQSHILYCNAYPTCFWQGHVQNVLISCQCRHPIHVDGNTVMSCIWFLPKDFFWFQVLNTIIVSNSSIVLSCNTCCVGESLTTVTYSYRVDTLQQNRLLL